MQVTCCRLESCRISESGSRRLTNVCGSDLSDVPVEQIQHQPSSLSQTYTGGEAEYFVRGLETGIFRIDEEGYVQSPVLPTSCKSTRKKALCLFWHRTGRRFLFREGICQVSTMAALTLKYGFPPEQIKMEPTLPDQPELSFAVDILLKSPQGTQVAFCEVKRDDRELDKLISDFRYCCASGSHPKNECKFRRNHPKYALCVEFKPEYFMAVSPGREFCCFQLSYSGHSIALTDVPVSSVVSKLQSSI